MAIQRRPVIEFTPTEFSTAKDKMQFYMHFIRFVESGFKHTLFPKWFYTRLSMTFSHIAHYNIDGFYQTWFVSKRDQLEFLEHCLRYPCYGTPTHTYCDVERELQRWIMQSGIVGKLVKEIKTTTEARERAQLAHLKAKYEPEGL